MLIYANWRENDTADVIFFDEKCVQTGVKCNLDTYVLTLNCIRSMGFHGTQHFVFGSAIFKAVKFLAEYLCN